MSFTKINCACSDDMNFMRIDPAEKLVDLLQLFKLTFMLKESYTPFKTMLYRNVGKGRGAKEWVHYDFNFTTILESFYLSNINNKHDN